MHKPREASEADARQASASASPGCSSFKVRQLSRRVSQHFDRIVAGRAEDDAVFAAVARDAARAGAPGELAAEMEMDASTLTRNLQPLVRAGWLEIGPGEDGRSRASALTAPAARSAPKRSASGSGRRSRSTSSSAKRASPAARADRRVPGGDERDAIRLKPDARRQPRHDIVAVRLLPALE
jgi:hypothetical protein